MKLLPLVAIFATLALSARAEYIRLIRTMTANCQDCGMGVLGQLHIKICGKNSPNVLGGICCAAIDLNNLGSNDFQEGQENTFTTSNDLGECYQFDLGTLTGASNDVHMTLFHTGSDGGTFEWVEVETSLGYRYQCPFGQFMDGSVYNPSSACFRTT